MLQYFSALVLLLAPHTALGLRHCCTNRLHLKHLWGDIAGYLHNRL